MKQKPKMPKENAIVWEYKVKPDAEVLVTELRVANYNANDRRCSADLYRTDGTLYLHLTLSGKLFDLDPRRHNYYFRTKDKSNLEAIRKIKESRAIKIEQEAKRLCKFVQNLHLSEEQIL